MSRLASAVAELSGQLYRRGWMEGTAGNISVRTGETALITASGLSKGSLTADDLVEIEAGTGRPLSADAPQPSAETSIHAALYRTVAGCGAVVHAHPPYATIAAGAAFSAGSSSIRFTDYEIIKGLGQQSGSVEVPIFANPAKVSLIADAIADHLTEAGPDVVPVLLIAHHGATAWGPTLESARNRLECLEMLCQLDLLSHPNRGVSR
ncbi:MAG: methylthioribulose 1-phosphate dehydratase [Actinomycetota bacterium]|nr:methylthioribulose 1-phosphate dehydratase [Actinomycetota bacterium]